MKKLSGFKRVLAVMLALALVLPSLTVQVHAAPVDVTPYEVQVTAEDGQGVNMRSGPASTYDKVRATPIPMWEILTVTKEETNSYGKLWGYVTYEGVSGWISMTEVTRLPVDQGSSVNGPEDVIFFQDSGEVTGEMAAAYLNVLNNAISTYGVMVNTSDDPDYHSGDWDSYHRGIACVRLMDFDGDGFAEMYFTYADGSPSWEASPTRQELWYFDGTTAQLATGIEAEEGTLWRTHRNGFVKKDGNIYLYSVTAGPSFGEELLYRLENGKLIIDCGRSQIKEDGEFITSGDIGCDLNDGELVIEDSIDHDLKWRVNDVLAVRQKLVDMIPAEELDPLTLLNGITYIGDRSKCRMDEDMANAFAKVLEEQPYVYKSDDRLTLSALLVELSGDGYPIMVTLYCDHEWYCSHAAVWEYRNGTAVAYDFSEEFSYNGYGRPSGFSVSDGYFVASSSGGGGVDPIEGGCYYEVIGGRLVLRHERQNYPYDDRYFLDGKEYAGWEEANAGITDPPSHYKEDRTIVECGSDLYLGTSVTDAKAASALLRAYAKAAAYSCSYPEVTEDDDLALVTAIAEAIADAVGGEIQGIYKLADGVYYVIITVDGEKKSALVRGVRREGQVVWNVDEVYDAPLSSDELDAAVADIHSSPNLILDYGKISGTAEETKIYLQEVLDNMDGVTPNDAAKSDLAAFIESAIAASCTDSVTAKDNRLNVTADTVTELAEKAQDTLREMDDLMADNAVSMNKTLTIMIRIVWSNVNREDPCQITLDETVVDALDGCTLQILLGDARHYIQISAQRLEELIDLYDAVVIQISGGEDSVYTINFLDEDGEVLEQIKASVTVGLPAEDALSTIMVSYAGGSDNWGGQYDPNAGVLSFETQYSGQYEVLHNGVEISDIGGLSEEEQAAVAFMVSKGYLALEGDCFAPDAPLSRYDFTKALVGMFFALDRELTTTFADVPADSSYYPYVASAQSRSIVEGFDDGTFGGEQNITVEQMLALAARTLIDQKGYALPTEAEELLSSFSDRDQVKDWAKELVALAVREGIMDRSGALSPQSDITRAQAALILYRLFLLLYEVPPVALELPEAIEEELTGGAFGGAGFTMPDLPIMIVGAVAVVTVAALIATVCFLVVRRKKGN